MMHRESLDGMLRTYAASKRQLIEFRRTNSEVPGDPPIFVFLGPEDLVDDQSDITLMVIPDEEMLIPAFTTWIAEFKPPAWIAVIMDIYGCILPAGEAPPEGELSDEFTRGNPNVYEALALTAADHHGDLHVLECRYWYDDDGNIWFRDFDIVADSAEDMTSGLSRILMKVVSLYGKDRSDIILEMTFDEMMDSN